MSALRWACSLLFSPIEKHREHIHLVVPFMGLLLLFDGILTHVIIAKVPYTEIDWVAYMQEVAGVMGGERDYRNLKGDTGPLVYPGGFVWIYSALYRWTGAGADVALAQRIFAALYLATAAAALAIYRRTPAVAAPAAMGLLVLSKRVHSLFVLRLFNEGPAMAALYTAVLLFTHRRWRWGCVAFSVAVSVKMNVLLFSPGLLLLLIEAHESWAEVAACLGLCAAVQAALGLPFLAAHPLAYLTGAFDLKRVFMFEWTVNWKFLSDAAFTSPALALGLLAATLAAWAFFFAVKWPRAHAARYGGTVLSRRRSRRQTGRRSALSAEYVVATLFVSNFVGVCFARTLHYQFYAWYFHQLPWLLWLCPALPVPAKLLIAAAVEAAFLTYPATAWSSAGLQAAHCALLAALALAPVPEAYDDGADGADGGAGGKAREKKRS